MRVVQPLVCAFLLAVGCAWAAWLMAGHRPNDIAAAGLGIAVAVSFAAYLATDRKDAAYWLRLGLYGGAFAVACASLWTGAVRPLQHEPSLGAVVAWLGALDGMRLVMLVVPPPAAALLGVLFLEVTVHGLKRLAGADKRRRAESDLHGRAQLLGRRFLRRLARRKGILLGQWGNRMVWSEAEAVAALEQTIHSLIENVAPDGTQLADERESLLWGFVNMLHAQAGRIDRTADKIVLEMRDLERAQDGTEVKALELERLTERARNLGDRRDAFETMRDFAAEGYRVETGNVWRPRQGSHTSRTGRHPTIPHGSAARRRCGTFTPATSLCCWEPI